MTLMLICTRKSKGKFELIDIASDDWEIIELGFKSEGCDAAAPFEIWDLRFFWDCQATPRAA